MEDDALDWIDAAANPSFAITTSPRGVAAATDGATDGPDGHIMVWVLSAAAVTAVEAGMWDVRVVLSGDEAGA